VIGDGTVAGLRNNFSVPHDGTADRHLPPRAGRAGFFKGYLHE
jgi:hypothetical protein